VLSDRFKPGAVYELLLVTHKLVILTETRYLLTYLPLAISIADEAAKSLLALAHHAPVKTRTQSALLG